jgi:hypothetical protein
VPERYLAPAATIYTLRSCALDELAHGLWRWTAPHPEWIPDATPGSPADWEQHVGSVLYEGSDAAVFFDPLLPPDARTFWSRADERVAGRRVAVLTTIAWHRRSRTAFVERYGATFSRAKRNLPHGVESFVVRGAGETIYWLPEHRALIPGDRILGGSDGALRLCPESWLRYLTSGITVAELKTRLRPLLELPVERVLVSHGQPVVVDGGRALARALAAN